MEKDVNYTQAVSLRILFTEIPEAEMIKVLMKMSARDFSEKLAVKLSENTHMFRIDFDEDGGVYDFVIDDSMQDEILPVSALSERIIGSYTERTGKPFYGPENDLRRVFVFSSSEGGSGLSSAAFSFARILCGKTGIKTLYVDSGPGGRFLAGEYEETADGSEKELRYMVRKKGSAGPMRYLSSDRFGPFVICIEKPDEDLIRQLISSGGFRQTVISCPETNQAFLEGAVRIAVINARDARSAETENVPEGYDFLVRNREYINKTSGNIISLADDPVSFKLISGKMMISMSGEFGIGVEKLVKAVTGDEEGIFWKMS